MRKLKKHLKRVLFVILSIFLSLHIIPYMLPLPIDSGKLFPPFDESRYMVIDGIKLHHRSWFPESLHSSSKFVLLVHGMGGSTFSWRKQVLSLEQAGHIVVSVDLPGFGYSDRARGFKHSQANRAELLWTFLDQFSQEHNFEIVPKWTLIGHSMGAGVITEMALQQPDHTDSLVFVGPAVSILESRFTDLLRYPPAGRWFAVLMRYVFINQLSVQALLGSAYGRIPAPEETTGYLMPFLWPGTEHAFLDIATTSTQTEVSDLENLNKTCIPVLAIWGEKDSWVPADNADDLGKLIQNLTLIKLPDAHHCPMETAEERFNDLILNWLE